VESGVIYEAELAEYTWFFYSAVAMPRPEVDYASATAAVQPMTIHEIHREVVMYPNGYSSYAWKIKINWPPKNFISFRSSGFTKVSRIPPITSGAQYLSPSKRTP
jgi:hypothetical protein